MHSNSDSRTRRHRGFFASLGISLLVAVTAGIWGRWDKPFSSPPPALAQGSGYALRLYGNGFAAPGRDRVLIPIDAPPRPVDVGATDFTIEFWMRALPGENGGVARCNEKDGWIDGNIIFDRDIDGSGDYGDLGISLGNGRVVFGVSVGAAGTSVCSSQSVADGQWHHIAAVRTVNGAMQLFVDGALQATAQGAAGNASYRDGRTPTKPNDPFIVLGAEKHDIDAAYPSFSGWLDELRISAAARYTAAFTRPTAPFMTDSQTAGLYHFDEGPAGACTGSVFDTSGATNDPSHGVCAYGGSPAGPIYDADTPFSSPLPTNTWTPVPPTATNTSLPPTSTGTATPVPPTATNTPLPPTSTGTATPVPPTATNTPLPPTSTGTATPVPPTATGSPTVTPTPAVTPTPDDTAPTETAMPTGQGTLIATPTATAALPPCPTATPTPEPDSLPGVRPTHAPQGSDAQLLYLPLIQQEALCTNAAQ